MLVVVTRMRIRYIIVYRAERTENKVNVIHIYVVWWIQKKDNRRRIEERLKKTRKLFFFFVTYLWLFVRWPS